MNSTHDFAPVAVAIVAASFWPISFRSSIWTTARASSVRDRVTSRLDAKKGPGDRRLDLRLEAVECDSDERERREKDGREAEVDCAEKRLCANSAIPKSGKRTRRSVAPYASPLFTIVWTSRRRYRMRM